MQEELKAQWAKLQAEQANFKYYKDPETHFRINQILKRMMQIECSSGQDNTDEEDKQFYKRKQLLYYAIRQWDEEYYQRIKP